MEICSLKMCESSKLVERDVIGLGDEKSYGFIIVDDTDVMSGGQTGEHCLNVGKVGSKLFPPVLAEDK